MRRRGLGARLWTAVLAASAVASAAGFGAVWLLRETEAPTDTRTLLLALGAASLVGLAIAAILGAWLARGVVGGIRRIRYGLAAGHLAERHARSRIPEWGEIGDVSAAVRGVLQRQRHLIRVEGEHERLTADLARLVAAVERWVITERWEAQRVASPSLTRLVEGLNQGFARWGEVLEQNREVARAIRAELEQAIDVAKDSTQRAEHGFVEATALLTTLREITRLGGEVQSALARPAAPPEAAAGDWPQEAARSLEDLVGVSSDSVQHLGDGLLRVQEISSQVQLLSNRATLVALNALMAGGRPREDGDAWTAELRQLAHDVREATDRVQKLTSEIEGDVAAATRRMQEVRERTRARLADLQAAPPPPPPAAEPAGLLRLSERLREMVQDAARKGERLSETGEQASRAAERLVRHLEDARHDMDGLAVRLAPAGGADAARADAPAPAPDLRLLDAEGGDAATDPREADRP